MKNIGIFTNIEKDTGLEFTKQLIKRANELGMNAERAEDKDYDLIISLGGDGTFLNAAVRYFNNDIPIAGINLGNMGYLSTVGRDELDEVLVNILNDNFEIEKRMLLEATVDQNKLYALNDVVLTRGNYKKMINVETFLDGKYVDTYNGDGLIVATPTGSTAYSLSAGGPIIEPIVDALIVTPICPHSLNKRPLITSSDRVISVESKAEQTFVLTTDGHESLTGVKSVEIRKAEKKVKVVRLKDNFFFDTLREKFRLI